MIQITVLESRVICGSTEVLAAFVREPISAMRLRRSGPCEQVDQQRDHRKGQKQVDEKPGSVKNYEPANP